MEATGSWKRGATFMHLPVRDSRLGPVNAPVVVEV